MNLDDFKSDWKQQHDQLAGDHFDATASDLVTRVAKLEASIWRRDLIETAAAAFVLIGSGFFLSNATYPIIAGIGMVIVMLSVVEVAVVLHWTRYRDDRPKLDWPLLDFCTAELARVERQMRLLRRVTWWYSGPMMLGCCVFVFGLLNAVPQLPARVFWGFLAAFYACFLAVVVILYRANSRAVDTQLVPFRDELSELVRSLEGSVSEGSISEGGGT